MFGKVLNLSDKKSTKMALLFYIVCMVAGIMICGIGTIIVSIIIKIFGVSDIQSLAIKIGPVIAGLYSLCVSLAILSAKNLYKNISAILCVIIAAFASSSLGLLIGFIPVAVLTAFEKNEQ